MKPARIAVVSILCLWIAAGCQQSLAPKLSIGDAMPDFILVTIACIAVFTPRWSAGLFGFLGGLLHGALAGANLAAYIVSRSVAGFMVGWFGSMELDRSIIVGVMASVGSTLVANVLLMFVAPPTAILPFLLATIATAIYNGVIAVPTFAVLRRLLEPPR